MLNPLGCVVSGSSLVSNSTAVLLAQPLLIHPCKAEQKACSAASLELMRVVPGRCHYKGKLASNNAMFDSSYERGRPLSFKIGVRQVIAGEGHCV